MSFYELLQDLGMEGVGIEVSSDNFVIVGGWDVLHKVEYLYAKAYCPAEFSEVKHEIFADCVQFVNEKITRGIYPFGRKRGKADRSVAFHIAMTKPWLDFSAGRYDLPDFYEICRDHDAEWGFDDEYTTCCGCYKAIRTEPDSYSWTPDYIIGDGEIYCGDCAREDPESEIDSLLEKSMVDGPQVANILDNGSLESEGFVMVNNDYESGFYGVSDDPATIQDDLKRFARLWIDERFKMDHSLLDTDVLFTHESEQFRTVFRPWLRIRYDGETDVMMSNAIAEQFEG